MISGETTIPFASMGLANANFEGGFVKSSPSDKPFGVEFAFTTESIDEDFDKAKKAGAAEVQAVVEKPWGQKVGYVRDNNGFLIEICTPIKH